MRRRQKREERRWLEKTCNVIEEFFDTGDAVKRRKIANLIYKDLVAERISSDRAAMELQALNSRQKGGWTLKKVQRLRNLLARKNMFGHLKKL